MGGSLKGLILIGQKKCGCAAVGLGDDPKTVFTVTFSWLSWVYGVSGEDAESFAG